LHESPMPELPEVEVIRRDLVPRIQGRRICEVSITERRLTRRRGTPAEVAATLLGCRVTALRRRGKFLFFDMEGESLVVRLGMTGQLLWTERRRGFERDQHTHAVLCFEGGGRVLYRDIRKFGEMFLLPTATAEQILGIGIEPLDPGFTPRALRRVCQGKRRIKTVLLDQTRIAGIGNIYADEALFRAGIRPTRRAASLRPEELRRLHAAIRQVLQAGILHRGSSISNYRDACGRPGRFAAQHRVYHRHGMPCLSCGTTIRRILLGQRGTHYCPACQR
jgi:formamidopyrimidine-DNA glycosylase